MEFIGTFFLVLAIGLTGDPLAIGTMLMVMVYMGGHISGAHYNPAVSLGAWKRGALKSKFVTGYMVSQCLAAFVAAIVIYLLQGSLFVPAPAAGVSLWQAAIVEILFTFILVSVILTVATGKALKGNDIYGLAIGFTLMVGVYAGGAISGAVYNPAVAIGPMILSWLMGQGINSANLFLYILAPLIGGCLAALGFKYLNPKD